MSITFSSNQMYRFAQDPEHSVLRLHNNEILAEKKGVWTWLKSHLFYRQEYNLSNIVSAIQQIDSLILTAKFVQAVNGNIASYNCKHQNSAVQQVFKQAIQPTSPPPLTAAQVPSKDPVTPKSSFDKPVQTPAPPTSKEAQPEESAAGIESGSQNREEHYVQGNGKISTPAPHTIKPPVPAATMDRVGRALEKVNAIPHTLEEDIKEYVQTFLHPYVTGEITPEKDKLDRPPMIEKMLNEIRKQKPLTDEEVAEIEQVAFAAYITEEAKRAFVNKVTSHKVTRNEINFPGTFKSNDPLIGFVSQELQEDKIFQQRFEKAMADNKTVITELRELAKDYPDVDYQIDNLIDRIEAEQSAIATAKQRLLAFLRKDIERDFPARKGMDLDKVADEAIERLKAATQTAAMQINAYRDETMPAADNTDSRYAKFEKLQELEKRGHLFLLPEVPTILSELLERFVPPLTSKQPAFLTTDDEFEIRWRFRQLIDSKPAISNPQDGTKRPQFQALKQYVESLKTKLGDKLYIELWTAVEKSICEELSAKK